MALPAWLTGLFAPALETVDRLVTTQEERGQIRLSLIQAQIGMAEQVLDYEARLAEAKSKIIIAEAQGQSWLQRNWRPLIMTIFGVVIAWNYVVVDIATWGFAIFTPSTPPPPRVPTPEGLWTLLQIGIGGYIVARSGEKVAATLASKKISFGKKEDE